MAAPRPYLESVVLITALIADIFVLYFLEDPAARLSLGLLLLAPIVWRRSGSRSCPASLSSGAAGSGWRLSVLGMCPAFKSR